MVLHYAITEDLSCEDTPQFVNIEPQTVECSYRASFNSRLDYASQRLHPHCLQKLAHDVLPMIGRVLVQGEKEVIVRH